MNEEFFLHITYAAKNNNENRAQEVTLWYSPVRFRKPTKGSTALNLTVRGVKNTAS